MLKCFLLITVLVVTGAAGQDRLTELVDMNRVIDGDISGSYGPNDLCVRDFGDFPDPVEGAVATEVDRQPSVCGGAVVS